MTYENSYMFRHRGAIFRDLLQQRCISQPTTIYFVHSHNHNEKACFLEHIQLITSKYCKSSLRSTLCILTILFNLTNKRFNYGY